MVLASRTPSSGAASLPNAPNLSLYFLQGPFRDLRDDLVEGLQEPQSFFLAEPPNARAVFLDRFADHPAFGHA